MRAAFVYQEDAEFSPSLAGVMAGGPPTATSWSARLPRPRWPRAATRSPVSSLKNRSTQGVLEPLTPESPLSKCPPRGLRIQFSGREGGGRCCRQQLLTLDRVRGPHSIPTSPPRELCPQSARTPDEVEPPGAAPHPALFAVCMDEAPINIKALEFMEKY